MRQAIIQDLVVRAAVETDRSTALQALILDPLCSHLSIAELKNMLNDLIQQNKPFLNL